MKPRPSLRDEIGIEVWRTLVAHFIFSSEINTYGRMTVAGILGHLTQAKIDPGQDAAGIAVRLKEFGWPFNFKLCEIFNTINNNNSEVYKQWYSNFKSRLSDWITSENITAKLDIGHIFIGRHNRKAIVVGISKNHAAYEVFCFDNTDKTETEVTAEILERRFSHFNITFLAYEEVEKYAGAI